MEHSSKLSNEAALRLLRLQSVRGLKGREQVKARILEIAEALGAAMICSHLSDYSRRFSKILRDEPVGVVDLILELSDEGKIRVFSSAGSNWVLPLERLKVSAERKAELSGMEPYEAEDWVTSLMIKNGRAHLGMPERTVSKK